MWIPLASDETIPQWVLDFFLHPVGMMICILTLISLVLIPKAGVSFRFRRGRFPVIWVTAVVCSVVAIVLYFLFRESAEWFRESEFPWVLIPAVPLGLNLALPLIHRLSGYRPATAELRVEGVVLGKKE